MSDSSAVVFSDHALAQMQRRGITREQVEALLDGPDKIIPVRLGRVVYQGAIKAAASDRRHLLRVFVDMDQEAPVVVTAYKTGKIDKYGSGT